MTVTEDEDPAAERRFEALGRSRQLTIKTLERIDELTLSSTPQMYELWYRYFDGDPAIVHALADYQGSMDEATCQKIYERYLSTSAHDTAIQLVSKHVQNSIAAIAGTIQAAQTSASEYGETLGSVTSQIQPNITAEQLAQVVSQVMEDTKKMVERNQELESQLENSSKQVAELTQYLETVKKEATTDGLTGVSNRKAFDREIAALVEEATNNKTTFTLMMIDIDHFKKFNDTYGHQTGDQVLRLVARTLISNIKGRDVVARYGGEEFSVMLPATPLAPGRAVADMLRKSIESKELIDKAAKKTLGAITVSIGVAQFRQGEDIPTLIERADVALYQAKKNGRNQVCVAAETE